MHQPEDFIDAYNFFRPEIERTVRSKRPMLAIDQAFIGNRALYFAEQWTGIDAEPMHLGGGLHFDGYVQCETGSIQGDMDKAIAEIWDSQEGKPSKWKEDTQ